MLAAAERWGGGADERPFLPRAFSVAARATPAGRSTSCWRTSARDRAAGRARPGRRGLAARPARRGFAPPREGAPAGPRRRRRRDRAARDLARRARRRRAASCSASATPRTPRARRCCAGARVATDDGSVGHHGLVTELLREELRRPARRGLRLRPAADARGRARAVRRARRPGAARAGVRHGLRLRRVLRLRRADPRRLRAAVRRRPGARRRRRWSRARDQLLRHRAGASDRQRLGHLRRDRRAARRSATRCSTDFPFAAFVSKTVTRAPRQGNPPPRLWELGAGMINSIGLPNKGLEGYLAEDLPRLAELPVPLIVNVMGSAAEDVARARRRVRRARRGRGAGAQRLLPERQDRAADGRRPGGDRGAARRGAPADR